MITNRRTLFLGIFIVLIPFLGFPSSWKTFMIVISGLTLISFSVEITIPKKISKRPLRRKETITPVFRESIIIPTTPVQRKDKDMEVGVEESGSEPSEQS